MTIPAELRWLFWELDPTRLDRKADAGYIISRVIEHGGLTEVRWVIAHYGLDKIHAYLREVGHSELSDRTIGFWRAVFAAKDEPWASPPAWRKNNSVRWSV